MAQINIRKSKMSKEITYKDIEKALNGRDINNLTQQDLTELEQLGFGDWIGRNWGNVAQVAGGVGAMFVPGMQGVGAGLIAGGVSGVVGDAKEQKAIQAQNDQTAQIQQQQEVQAKQNALFNSPNVMPSYGAVMRCGGRLKKMQDGGNMTDPPKVGLIPKPVIIPTESLRESSDRRTGKSTKALEDYFAGIGSLQHSSYSRPSITGMRQILDPYDKYYKHYAIDKNDYIPGEKGGHINLPTQYIPVDEFPQYVEKNRAAFEGTKYSKYLDSFQNGGTINYEGQLHEGPNGGIPVDGTGNPSSTPVALTEGKEVAYNAGEQGTYVFSDTLKYDKNKTFADMSKALQNRYKLRGKKRAGNFEIQDPVAKKGYEAEMQKLISQQEQLKEMTMPQEQQQGLPIAERGGGLPKYDGISYTPTGTGLLPTYNNNFNFSPSVNTWRPKNLEYGELRKNYLKTIPPNYNIDLSQYASTKDMQPYETLINWEEGVNIYAPLMELPAEPKTSPAQGMTGWQTTAAVLPGVLSGAVNIGRGLWRQNKMDNPYTKLNLPEIQAEQINLENERAAAREQANVARANTSRGLRAGAPTGGSYMANMIAGETGIQRGLGQQLGQSYQNEALTNAQMRQQTAMANQQAKMQEQMYNAQLDAQWRSSNDAMIGAGISQIGQGVTGALNQRMQSRKDAQMLQMQNPDYTFQDTYKDNWFGRNFGRTTSATIRPETVNRQNLQLYESMINKGQVIPPWLQTWFDKYNS